MVCHQSRATEHTHSEVVVSAVSFNDNKAIVTWFWNLWLADIEGAKVQEKLCGECECAVVGTKKDLVVPFYSVKIY